MSKQYELTFRRTKGSPVTSDEIDQNFRNIKIGHDDHEKRVSSLEKINLDFATDEELTFHVQRLDTKIDSLNIPEYTEPYTDSDVQNYLTENNYVDEKFLEDNYGELTIDQRTAAFNNRFSAKTTTDLAEGSNLYYTDERAQDAVANSIVAGSNINLVYDDTNNKLTISATGELGYDLSSNTTSDLVEGTNKYYTDVRARASISASGSLSYDSTTGVISYTQPTNLSTFTNDVGYITDYTVTESDVTGHQSALSITESQILDLKDYLLDSDLDSIRVRLSNSETRISVLEGTTEPSIYTITAPDFVIAGSSGTDDDVVVVSTNALANSKFKFVVKYSMSSGIIVPILSQNDRQINFNLESKYDLNIPWHRDYNGAKIDEIIIEVYDDPNLAEPRPYPLATKTIQVLPAPESFVITTPTYMTQFEEGQTVTVTVNTTNMFNGSELQYVLSGIQEADTSTPLNGVLTLSNVDENNGTGSVQFDIVTTEDEVTEGDETLAVTINYSSQQDAQAFELLDTSRATEIITVENWIDEVVINQGGNTIADKQAVLDVWNTFRTDLLALTSPTDLNMTMTEVYLLLIKKSWIDNATLVEFPTSDQNWITATNSIIFKYNSDIQAAGVINDVHKSSPLMPRPSDGTRVDDVGYSFVYNNPSVELTLTTVLYTGIEEKPV